MAADDLRWPLSATDRPIGVFIPVARDFSVVDAVVHYSNQKLATHFKTHPQLALTHTEEAGTEGRVWYIRSHSEAPERLRLHQLSVDASGIMLARPDSYLPPVDIVREPDAYNIYMDLPGMTRDQVKLSRQNVVTIVKAVELHAGAHRGARPSSPQVKLSRQNVVTIVKGTRESGLSDREIATSVTRQERKAGEFTMTFRIPEEYQVRLPLIASDCH
jgi:HSP20 family molecular chaperone IbpA